jgi:hypothetical protein
MWSSHNDVYMLFLKRTREYLRQSICGQQRPILDKIADLRVLVVKAVGGYGDLPQNKGVSVNAFERMLLLFSDLLLEGADVLGVCNPDCECIAGVIALYQTVDFEVVSPFRFFAFF